jgi:endoglucanase
MKPITNRFILEIHLALILLLGVTVCDVQSAKLVNVGILDRNYLIVNISDGDVIHQDEVNKVEQILRYAPELDTSAAVQPGNWSITSSDDSSYGPTGHNPLNCSRKKKLSGHAELGWSGNDYLYEYTYEHWIYLQLPSPLQQGATYQLSIGSAVHSDTPSATFTFDQFNSVSEAIHINLVGYSPDAPHKAADLYYWMGSGGPRNYSSFQGNGVYLYNVDTHATSQVGVVNFWKSNGSDVHGYNLTGSDVWNVDFSSASNPGTYRLVVEGVGCSQDFEITDDIYKDPFTVSVRGYFYMRIGDSNPNSISPPPRTPRYIPGVSPPSTKVYLTTMHPFHPEWETFGGSGDKWDNPNAWAAYVKSGSPTNPNAWGGHSDAADWDRHLGHVIDLYDMLLPYLMTNGAINDDDLGISESGNGIPDIIDEARNEVDFWLRLRDGAGYSHGLTNPNNNNEFFQAGPTALAAWANAANAAMLADALRIAGLTSLMNQYKNAAIEAYDHASSLSNQMLDEQLYNDEGHLRGRDLKMMAAAFLYNVTGTAAYEGVINSESVCASGLSAIQYFNSGDDGINQLYGTAAYLITPQPVHYSTLFNNMKTQIISEAKTQEADLMNSRPSRRTTYNPPSYWRTAHFVGHTIVAHAVTNNQADKDYFRKALNLEADWGLGRNPLNIIEMTTATTMLESKKSIKEAATSGRDDGIPGVHPGHTPYLNLEDWWTGMVMLMPSKLYENSYPANVKQTWPIGETYFPSRWVYSHTEYTPRQTMKGKLALYGYLYGLADTPGPTHPTLSVSVEGVADSSGTVTSSPAGINCGNDCSESYPNGTPVTLTVTANSGSVFTGWNGACFGQENTCNIVMNMNRSVVANFEPVGQTYTLTVALDGNGSGSVSSAPAGIQCGSDCSSQYLSGTAVTLAAHAEAGSSFIGWGGSCSGTGACQITMSTARSVSANFRSNVSPEIFIYDDALGENWENWSWSGTFNLSGTSPVHGGTHSANITLGGWGAFSPSRSDSAETIDTYGYSGISFWIHGGSTGKQINFFTDDEGGQSSNTVIITAVANTWTEINVSLEELGNPSSINRLNFFNNSGSAISMFTLDEIRLVPAAIGPVPGDVNKDGLVDLYDAINALKSMVNYPASTDKDGDVNGDNRIGIEEVIYILKLLSNPAD